ncbi:MAG: DMT family transporter [Burkholderiales bacterium]
MTHAHIPPAAVLMIVGAVATFSIMDATIKTMLPRLPVPFLVWARWTFQVVAMLIWLGPTMGRGMVRTQRLPLQLVRGLLLISSSLCFFVALGHLPLAEATAINYTTPVLVILLAVVFLGERMTPPRIAFVFAGITGMLLIVRPGADLFRGASLLVLCSASFYAVFQVLTRLMAREDPRVMLLYPALVGAVAMTVAWPFFGSRLDLTWLDMAKLVMVGVLGTGGHFLLILAFQRAPASALTPFTYAHLVFATLVGWLVFGDFPDTLTLVGMAIIGGSGLLLTWHERRRALMAPAEPTAID